MDARMKWRSVRLVVLGSDLYGSLVTSRAMNALAEFLEEHKIKPAEWTLVGFADRSDTGDQISIDVMLYTAHLIPAGVERDLRPLR